MPDARGLKPSYHQRRFDEPEKQGKLRLVASPDGAEGSLPIHQDARLYLSSLEAGQTVVHPLNPGRHAWLQVLRGTVALNAHSLAQGDGAAVSSEEMIEIKSQDNSEILLFDLA